jgi:hypothetical protein
VTRSLGELIELADLNGLLAAVDAMCERRAWDELLDVADMCEDAVERGKQLWPIAAHVDYRIALEAPAEYAAGVLDSDAGRWAHGPLTEVVASSHSWTDLRPYLGAPHTAAYVAQERVLRGENLDGDDHADPEILEMPMSLQSWEPAYTLATFRTDHVEVSEVWEPRAQMKLTEPHRGPELDEPELVAALLDVVAPWTSESNGAARATVVEGDAHAAVSALSFGPFLAGPLTSAEAIQRMAWAAASGGAHGRRRGAAFGRLLAWQVAALVCEVAWPPDPSALGSAMDELSWWRWEETTPSAEGWALHLAVADPAAGWAAAIAATDVLIEE